MRTPVALLIYKRPEETRRVFDVIRRAQPETLLVVADGSRSVDEEAACEQARAATEAVDWMCDVRRLYADENMGCRGRVASGIDWVFAQCEEAIILEDDCLPHPSFFPFSEALLAHYRDDERVMMVQGTTFLPLGNDQPHSYHFSRYPAMWGWAGWRRAWEQYDVTMSGWAAERESDLLRETWGDDILADYWRHALDEVHSGSLDTWDLQWFLAMWRARGLAAVPNTNLISNIGFDENATHTKTPGDNAYLPTSELALPLAHPPRVDHNQEASQPYYDVWATKAEKQARRSEGVTQRLVRRIKAVFE
ncbi:MAG: glycosyltransferase family 2 protein [Anaerolineae bacterium]